MSINKIKPKGGSGGKIGHSNMDHWMHTDEVKEASRKVRRQEDLSMIEEGMKEDDESDFLIDYIRASEGEKIRVRHLPSGISIEANRESNDSQISNLIKQLREKIEQIS